MPMPPAAVAVHLSAVMVVHQIGVQTTMPAVVVPSWRRLVWISIGRLQCLL